MGQRGILIGRIAGIEIRADLTLLFLILLIISNLLPALSDRVVFPNLGGGAAFALAALTSILLVLSILAHELAHALMFRMRGIPVLGITLHMFGGVTQGSAETRRPWDEFIVTVVGPLTTAFVGVAFLLVRAAIEAPSPWRLIFFYLGYFNVFIAGINLLPGFPLDGGRVLLAGLWKLTGNKDRATEIAARVGQGFAALIVAYGAYVLLARQDFQGLWALIVGFMLFQSSSAALVQSRRRAALQEATVGQVMSPPPPTIAADLPISVALERHLDGHDGEAFPVMDRGEVVGFVSPGMARSVPLSGTVRDAMVGTDTAVVAGPDEPMGSLIQRITSAGAVQTILVMKDGRLVGVIEPEDVNRFVRRRRG